MKWSSNVIYRDKGYDSADQQSALESNGNNDDSKSLKMINPADNSQQEHDQRSLKPIHQEVFDEGGSISSKEKKMGIISKLGLALGALTFFASPILAMFIIFPILHLHYSKNSDDDKFSKHDRGDLTLDQISDRLQRVEDIENAIANAKANQQSSETEKSPLSFEDEASNQPPQTNQLKKNPLINGKPKPILKKPQPQVSIDALDLASSSKPVPAGIDGRGKQSNLAGDLAGIAKDLRGDPRSNAGEARPRDKKRVNFGPDQERVIQ